MSSSDEKNRKRRERIRWETDFFEVLSAPRNNQDIRTPCRFVVHYLKYHKVGELIGPTRGVRQAPGAEVEKPLYPSRELRCCAEPCSLPT